MTREELEAKFTFEVDDLSVRAKNILLGLELIEFNSFYNYFIKEKKEFEFWRARNCGQKTENELNEFVKNFKTYYQNFIIEDSENKDESNKSFSNRTTLIFNQNFEQLGKRSRSILSDCNANTIEGFYQNIIKSDYKILAKKLASCGYYTIKEINQFKIEVIKIINDNSDKEEVDGLFGILKLYLFEKGILSPIELYIFQYYFCFTQNERIERLEDIGFKFKLSRERVRQISVKLVRALPNKIVRLTSSLKLDWSKYFIDNSFIIDRAVRDKINESENAFFEINFITLVLSCLRNPKFYFYATNRQMTSFSGIFLKKTVPIDFFKCFKYLDKLTHLKKEKDIRIDVEFIFEKFQKNQSERKSLSALDLVTRSEMISALLLYQNIINPNQDKIEVNSEGIVFKRNKKIKKYEYLVDILREFKKPMHFTQLYEECCKRNIKIASESSVHSAMQLHPTIFGLKGPGIYGLIEWGGYFGMIGDVAEKLLHERGSPIARNELEDILCRELYISKDSIKEILFHYDMKDRFIRLNNGTVALKEWQKNK
jgi:hypothetical protein